MKKIIKSIFLLVIFSLVFTTTVFANQKLDAIGKKNLRSANMHKGGKRYDKAIGFYLKVLEENPDHIEAAEKLGDIYFSAKQDYENAYKYLVMAIKSIDKEIDEYKKLQQEKPKKKKKYQKKINKYLKEKEKIQKYVQSCWIKIYKQGIEKVQKNEYLPALKVFMHLNEIAPDSSKTLKMISYCYLKSDSLDKAIKYLNKALQIKEDYKARAQLADLYFKKKDFENAAKQYEILIKNDPKNPDNYYNICLVYTNLKDFDKALENINKFIELKPDDKDGYALAFETARMKDGNDLDTQIKYYKKYADLDKDNPVTMQYIFSLLYKAGKYNEALKYGEIWFNLDKTKETAKLIAGCAYQAGKKDLYKKYNKIAENLK